VSVRYCDTSALARCYFADEPDSEALRSLLVSSSDPVITAQLATVELRSSVAAAVRAGRLRRATPTLDRIQHDLASGAITLVPMTTAIVEGATELVMRHVLRTLDALHLATALHARALSDPEGQLVFITRDRLQATAARGEGLAVE
jgi:predicted nucleic acid-binding protein